MSLVCIRIDDASSSRDVTDVASRLAFTRSAPGGYVGLKVTINLPLATFKNLGPASKVIVTDPRSGRTLWEGWAEYPGEKHANGGESWDLAAVGNSVLAYDQAQPVVYIDRDLSVWTEAKSETMPQSARAEVTDNPRGGGGEGLFTGLPKGTTAGLALQAQIGYSRIREAGMRIGGLSVSITAGRNDGDYRSQLTWTTGPDQGSAVLQSDSGIYTDVSRLTRFAGAGGVHPPAGTVAVALRIIRVTSGGAGADIPDDTHWLWHTDPVVIGQRMDQWGNLLVGSAALVTTEYVRADWVVADVVGRYLPSVGPDLARIDYPVDAWPIDQLSFNEPTRAGDILDILSSFEPDMLWELLETVEGEGVRFNYRPWGTTHRYELQMDEHQLDLPAPDVDLCDRVAVRWTDNRGRDRTTVVTSVVPDLIAAGRSPHDAPAIDLPDGIGSVTNAQRAGQRYLAALNARTVAGTAFVKGRIYDRLLNLTVEPYELEAGHLVLIREKGLTVRLTNVEYDDDQQAATLTLGTPQRTQDQVLATIASRARVKRRAA